MTNEEKIFAKLRSIMDSRNVVEHIADSYNGDTNCLQIREITGVGYFAVAVYDANGEEWFAEFRFFPKSGKYMRVYMEEVC